MQELSGNFKLRAQDLFQAFYAQAVFVQVHCEHQLNGEKGGRLPHKAWEGLPAFFSRMNSSCSGCCLLWHQPGDRQMKCMCLL